MPTSPVEFALAFSTGLVAFALVVSGAGKITHTASTLAAMTALRVPVMFRRPMIARAVPCVEILLALGMLLLPAWGRVVSGALAALMLAMFTALLIGVLLRGEEADCGCFGVLGTDTRVTPWSVLRNLVLLVAAVTTAVLGVRSGSFAVELIHLDILTVLLVVLGWAAVLIVVLARMLVVGRGSAATASAVDVPRSNPAPLSPLSIALGIDPARPGEVRIGDPIPPAELVSDRGEPRVLAELGNGRPTLLIFVSVDCGNCRGVAEAVPSWQHTIPGIAIRIATSSDPAALAAAYPDLASIARFGSRASLEALGVQRSPAAVLLGGQHQPIIASAIAYGHAEIDALVQSIAAAGV